MKRRSLVLLLTAILFLSAAGARTTFGSGNNEPLPNVTELRIYDVTGLSPSEKETGGSLEDRGINQTFLVNQSEQERQYRFGFEIVNDGENSWGIQDLDNLSHEGLDASWGVDKIWYNISSDYDGGSLENGEVSWDTSNGGTLAAGDKMYAKYLVNISITNSQTYEQKFLVNDSSENSGSFDNHVLDANKLGFLNLTLEEPPNDTALTKNRFFQVNSTVTCEEGECGEVNVNPRYNESEKADTIIPRDSGKPFYTNTSRTKTCDSSLDKDQTCLTDWFVNASGELESWHLLDVNASSSFSGVEQNDTEDNLAQINTALIFDLEWDTTRFGVLEPGSLNNSAIDNDRKKHNLSVDERSQTIDKLWLRSTWLQAKNSDYNISAENMSYSLQNDISTENFLSTDYQIVEQSIDPGTVLNFFFWIDVPSGIAEGEYNGTLVFKANSTG